MNIIYRKPPQGTELKGQEITVYECVPDGLQFWRGITADGKTVVFHETSIAQKIGDPVNPQSDR